MNRRAFVEHSIRLLAVASVPSCGYHKVRMGPDTTSKESVSAVLISSDDKKLVVITSQFHYVFDAPSPLVQTLKGTLHPFVHCTLSQFHVDINGKASGTISLLIPNSPNLALSPLINAALSNAVAAGFTRTSSGAEYITMLHGDRYSAGDVQPAKQYQLNKTYEIEVVSEGYGYRASPVGAVAGEMAIGGLILFSLPVAAVSGQK
jgi:hypothetical protein